MVPIALNNEKKIKYQEHPPPFFDFFEDSAETSFLH